jgi:hypothetical protein
LRKTFPAVAGVIVLSMAPGWTSSEADPAGEFLALERQVMDGWLKGDPDPQLAISDPQITYIHDVVGKRLDGIAALKGLYEQYRGVPLFDRYELLSPKVQVTGDVAVVTYQLAQHNGSATRYWNGSQIYRKNRDGWRIIHAHWSGAKERQP